MKWDKFLTERDKQHLVQSGLRDRQPVGFGDQPAVIVVDDYYAALGLKRQDLLESVETWPLSCGLEGWNAIDRTVELLQVAREAGVPIVYLRGLEGFPSPSKANFANDNLAHLPPEARGKANEIVDEVAPLPGDLVIEKAASSGFHGTPLLFHLNYLRIDTLIVCGESTSGCVRATVTDGANYRYRMAVVHDCCFDRTEAAHWMNLFDMHQKYADVVDRDQATTYLRSLMG